MSTDLLLDLLLDPCGTLSIGLVMYAAGNRASAENDAARRVGAALAGAALIAVMFFGILSGVNLLTLAAGAAGVGLFVLGTCWIIFVIVFVMFGTLAAAMSAPHRQPEQVIVTIPAKVWEPTPLALPAPDPEAYRTGDAALRRRENIRADCEMLFSLLAPEIGDRFTRELFEDYVKRYLHDGLDADEVERRGEQLQDLLRQHHEKAVPPKANSLSELAQWFERRKTEIDALPVEDGFKRSYVAMLNARFQELTKEQMEMIT